MQLSRFDIDNFLSEHWQKKPVLIRNPWNRWENPIEPDELAGLACEEGVESRLISQDSDNMTVENGPLPEDRFGSLTRGPWTLLVQAVDQQSPDVAALIEPFRFVPDWRIDDVMVSYATDGGGVGAHFDQYDVFLIQGLGKRRWRVGQKCDSSTPLAPHEDFRLLADFQVTDEWILEPGDILYVPPGFAHDGVAVGDDCMTYSVGFRAPSRAELIEGWSEYQSDTLLEEDRYSDPDLPIQAHPGEITSASLDRLQAMVIESLSDKNAFARWFGVYNSLPKYADTDWSLEEPIELDVLPELIAHGATLYRNPASRFAFIQTSETDVMLFVDGQCFDCDRDTTTVAKDLCDSMSLAINPALADSAKAIALIAALLNQGSLAFGDEG